jgi:tetratricopeptide (TPR) repeat protein
MSRLKRLIVEIHRRSLWQVLTVYLVSSWIALQVADTVTAVLGLPDWVPSVALVLLIVLLPVVLATAFVQEGVGGGVARREAAPVPGTEVSEAAPSPEVPGRERGGVHHRVFTWHNAIVAGVAMLALLTVSAGGYMGLRAAGIGPFGTLMSKGVLEERDRIVLADFENHTADSLLGMAATRLFRTALSQSTVVSVASEQEVARVLEHMRREPDTPLDYDLAREVAIRDGLKAVIAGEIISVGAGYVVSARLVGAEGGEELWADSETAADSTEIIPAIDWLTRKLRERIGESLRTVRGTRALHRVTTSSLEALKKYTQGVRAYVVVGDYVSAAARFQEAVSLDTAFSVAYIGLAFTSPNRSVQMEAFSKAFEHRDRLTESDRYFVEAVYHRRVTGELEKAVAAYRALIDIYSAGAAFVNLGNIYLYSLRGYEEAEQLYERGIEEADSACMLCWSHLVAAEIALGKADKARFALDQLTQRFPEHPQRSWVASAFSATQGDYDGAEAEIRALKERSSHDLNQQGLTMVGLAILARLQGRLAEAERHLDDAIDARDGPWSLAAFSWQSLGLPAPAWFKGDTAAALERVKAALVRWPLDSIPLLDRPYGWLVDFYAWAGQTHEARACLAEFEAQAEYKNRAFRMQQHYLLGHIAMSESRPIDAIEEYRRADDLEGCPVCALPSLAFAYDNAGQTDSALAAYERYVTTPWLGRMWPDSWWLALAYERLGDLYEQRGDTTKAVHYYGKLVDLWKDADLELQPRVEAAQRAIEALSPDR